MKKLIKIGLIIATAHFALTYFVAYVISDDLLFVLAPFTIMCGPDKGGCSGISYFGLIFISSLLIFAAFVLIDKLLVAIKKQNIIKTVILIIILSLIVYIFLFPYYAVIYIWFFFAIIRKFLP